MLTQQERDEVKRLVELGEPLPEKYRWKLFAEPRETELIWPGKTNEVTNVVLPFQTIEQIDEPRAEMEEKAADLFAVASWGGRAVAGSTSLFGATTNSCSRPSSTVHCGRILKTQAV